MVDYKALKGMGEKVGKGIKNTSNALYRWGQATYFAPSFYQHTKKFPELYSGEAPPNPPWTICVSSGNLLFNLGIPILICLANNYDPNLSLYALGTSAITNTTSGIYEWYKYERDKSKPKSLNSTGLEEEIEKDIEPKKPPIINPWDKDIGEIENLRGGYDGN